MNEVEITKQHGNENVWADVLGKWQIVGHGARYDTMCSLTEELRLVRVTEFGVDDTIDGGQNK
jgi:hypothetical protein